jgi:hypothetical protein
MHTVYPYELHSYRQTTDRICKSWNHAPSIDDTARPHTPRDATRLVLVSRRSSIRVSRRRARRAPRIFTIDDWPSVVPITNRRVMTRYLVPSSRTTHHVIHLDVIHRRAVVARASRRVADAPRLGRTETVSFARARFCTRATSRDASPTEIIARGWIGGARGGQRDDRPNPTRTVPRRARHVRHRARTREG